MRHRARTGRPLSVLLALPLLAWVLAWPGALAAAQAVQVPGTKVSLVPPEGFVAASQFPGFKRSDAGSSIIVTEIPAPVSKLRAVMTEEGLASQGMTLLNATPQSVSGQIAQLLHVTQTANGTAFEKWLVVLGDETQTVMIVGAYPQSLAEHMSDPIKQALLSANWDPNQQVGLLDGLNFRVKETETLKFATRMANTIMLTRDGAHARGRPEDPIAVVGASISEVAIGDLQGFARYRLSKSAEITGLSNVAGRELTIDGLPAFELLADASDQQSGTPLGIYQLVILNGNSYFLVQGIVGREAWSKMLPEFRQLAASLERVQ